ncbi:hypothetical protein RIF29_13276 [Crotalaria pallida]|uniref:AB hydrolase-1 domain-containing protein n=1 Tax=Crotalaria pallida TaxID=3830 RepID=A0AAN9IPD7_CROPI
MALSSSTIIIVPPHTTPTLSKFHFPPFISHSISHRRRKLLPFSTFNLYYPKITPLSILNTQDAAPDLHVHTRSSLNAALKHFSFVLTALLCRTWNWRGYSIRYQYSGNNHGPALVLIHGFGANSDHWRKNISVLAKSHRVYSIDLIGYGYSDKPNPRELGDDSFYSFETWATQLNDFCLDVVKDQAFFICNSIGGVVGLQAAVVAPQICRGVLLLNISLRMLHIKKQPWFAKPFISSFQRFLRDTAAGKFFFKTVATKESVRNILSQCYHDTSTVTDELVQIILSPGLEPGAAEVFLEFICYSGGPLPEELLPLVKCPVLIAWGDKDPWEPIEIGRNYATFDSVEDFIVLPNVGHCPQDEAPHLVNPLVESFVARHAKSSSTTSAVN